MPPPADIVKVAIEWPGAFPKLMEIDQVSACVCLLLWTERETVYVYICVCVCLCISVYLDAHVSVSAYVV